MPKKNSSSGASKHRSKWDDILSQIYCLSCGGDELTREQQFIHCVRCGQFFPLVSDILVAHRHPEILIQNQRASNFYASATIHDRVTQLNLLRQKKLISSKAWKQQQQIYKNKLKNLQLSEYCLRKAASIIQKQKTISDDLGCNQLIAKYFPDDGWPIDSLLDYFYKDHGGKNTTNRAQTIIKNALKPFLGKFPQDASVAILGSGAGGLISHLSKNFHFLIGVDLSFSSLFLANKVLNGQSFSFHRSIPSEQLALHQKKITINGKKDQIKNVYWLAADSLDLAFKDNSLSCVITEYLFDITKDQRKLAAEINRVLKPNGVWIDLSLPGAKNKSDLSNRIDMKYFLKTQGFQQVDFKCYSYSHIDLRRLDPSIDSPMRTTVLFSARKKVDQKKNLAAKHLFTYSRRHRERLLKKKFGINYKCWLEEKKSRKNKSQKTLQIQRNQDTTQFIVSIPLEEEKCYRLYEILSRLSENKPIILVLNELKKIGMQVELDEIISLLRELDCKRLLQD